MENNIKTYNDLINNGVIINGTYIGEFGHPLATSCICSHQSKHIALNRKISKSMVAMAMISQMMPYYGGEITDDEWEDYDITKYCLIKRNKQIYNILTNKSLYHFLAFHTAKQRDNFLKYNRQLVKDYLMIN